MTWGTIELEPEVARWLEELTDDEVGHAQFYIDLLEEQGVQLDGPTRDSCAASCASTRAGRGSA